MRLLIATVFAFFLVACQTVGIESDPDANKKAVIAATAIAVDAIGAYGKLPDCGSGTGDLCRKPAAYRDVKLIAQGFNTTLQASDARSSIFLTAGLLYFQYQAAKTIANTPGPTNPEVPPTPAVVAQLEALQAIDLLVNTADQRVRDAVGPNTNLADLKADLAVRVAALP